VQSSTKEEKVIETEIEEPKARKNFPVVVKLNPVKTATDDVADKETKCQAQPNGQAQEAKGQAFEEEKKDGDK
jgi:hypothetical protein